MRIDILDSALMAMAACNFGAAMTLGRRIDRRMSGVAPCEERVLDARRTTINDHLLLVALVAVFYGMYLSVAGAWVYLRLSYQLPGWFHLMLWAMLAACHMVMARVLMCARRAFGRLSRIRIGDPAAYVARYCVMAGENLCCVVARHRERGEGNGDKAMDGKGAGAGN